MALKLCSYNCKGFNMSKIKNIEMILKQCDILLIQETWALPREVGKINQYFPEYNTYGVSGIKDDILLAGRPYGGCSFLYKKSLSAKTEFMTMDSDRVCCVRFCIVHALHYMCTHL